MGTEAQPSESMGRRRALLTDSERRRIAADPEPNSDEENYRYQSISRVRNKIEDELPKDVEILEEHHPGLLEEFRSVVCADSVEDVGAQEVAKLRTRIQNLEASREEIIEERDELQGRLDHITSLHDEQVDATEALEDERDELQSDLEDCRERLEQAEGSSAEVPIGQIKERLNDAQQTLSRFRETTNEPTGSIEDVEGQIGRVLEVLEE